MIALGGPTLKHKKKSFHEVRTRQVSMIALGGPTLKLKRLMKPVATDFVSMIALGGPTLKLDAYSVMAKLLQSQ